VVWVAEWWENMRRRGGIRVGRRRCKVGVAEEGGYAESRSILVGMGL